MLTKEHIEDLEVKVEEAQSLVDVAAETDKTKSTETTKSKLSAASKKLAKATKTLEDSNLVFQTEQRMLEDAEGEKAQAVAEALEAQKSEEEEKAMQRAEAVSKETDAVKRLKALAETKPSSVRLRTVKYPYMLTINLTELGVEKVDGVTEGGILATGLKRIDIIPTRSVVISGEYLPQMVSKNWSYLDEVKTGNLVIEEA